MTNYTIGIEKLLDVDANSEEEAIKKAHNKLQNNPVESQDLKIIEAVEEV